MCKAISAFQNCLARAVTRCPRLCSVTPLLKSLHWLPVQFRIKYKICTLTYKVIHSCQPIYLHNLLKPLNRTRNLCSSDDDQLVVPRVSSKMGERPYSVAAPQLWNCIPLEIKKSKSSGHRGFRRIRSFSFHFSFSFFHCYHRMMEYLADKQNAICISNILIFYLCVYDMYPE